VTVRYSCQRPGDLTEAVRGDVEEVEAAAALVEISDQLSIQQQDVRPGVSRQTGLFDFGPGEDPAVGVGWVRRRHHRETRGRLAAETIDGTGQGEL
jgi:hypothetical protein